MQFDISTAFLYVKSAFDTVLQWSRTWYITLSLGGESYSISIFALALGAAVIYLILSNLPVWGDQEEE